jgi:glycosyltransferase involved in cell wall biosynthesis
MVREMNLGGIEYDVSKLARHIDRSRFQPHVACYLPHGVRKDEVSRAGIPIVHIPVASLRSRSTLRSALTFRRYIKKHRIQIVHAFDLPTDIFGVPLAILSGAPVAIASQLWFHDVTSGQWVTRQLFDISLRLSSAVYVNCQAIKQQLVERLNLDEKRVYVAHNGVETDVFHPPSPGRRSGGSTLTIGTVAVFRPVKDLQLLLHAFARLHRRRPAVRLVVAGSGPMLSDLEACRQELQLTDVCQLVPPPESTAETMRSIDIFVSASRAEGCSNALIEAMACGCCPVASRVGGTPELVAHGERGLLFETGNTEDLFAKLHFLVENPTLMLRFGDAAATFARTSLSVQAYVRHLSEFYQSLLRRARGA